jgi:hypothetical protein
MILVTLHSRETGNTTLLAYNSDLPDERRLWCITGTGLRSLFEDPKATFKYMWDWTDNSGCEKKLYHVLESFDI